jgi:hypothetical protein
MFLRFMELLLAADIPGVCPMTEESYLKPRATRRRERHASTPHAVALDSANESPATEGRGRCR